MQSDDAHRTDSTGPAPTPADAAPVLSAHVTSRDNNSVPPHTTAAILEPSEHEHKLAMDCTPVPVEGILRGLGRNTSIANETLAHDEAHPEASPGPDGQLSAAHDRSGLPGPQLKDDVPENPSNALFQAQNYGDSAVDNTDVEQDEMLYDSNADAFSDYGSGDSASFYSSLLSFATDYYWENGRRDHAHQGGRYPLPNDETELDREDMKHHEWMLVTDFRLHLAPIDENPQRILDIGTGTGIWAMQIADRYPSAEVIGTDISPVQPKWVPQNLSFEVEDLEAEWLYRPGSFDLVNVRFMFLAIKDYSAMLEQAFRTLKSGGYMEITELSTTPKATNSNYPQPILVFKWLDLFNEAMGKAGLTMRVGPTFKELLINAGFVDVVETVFDIPWGSWPEDRRKKAVGFWRLEQLKQGLQGITMKLFTHNFGWTPLETEMFLVDLRKELDDKSYHLLDKAYVVYGRKP